MPQTQNDTHQLSQTIASQLQHLPAATPWFCVSPDLRIVSINETATQLIGKTTASVMHSNCSDIFPWCSRSKGYCPLLPPSQIAPEQAMLCTILPNQQTEIDHKYHTIGLSFASPHHQIDILTSEIQEQIEQLHQQSQIYLDIAGVLIVSLNIQGIILSVNKKICEILGVTEAELVGKNWFECCVPSSIRTEVKGIFYSLLTDQSQSAFKCHETQVITAQGEMKHIVFTSHLLFNSAGMVSRVMLSGVDVTNQRLAEHENARLREHTDTLISLLHDVPQSIDLLLETTAEALLYFSESQYACISLLNETEGRIDRQIWSKSVRAESRLSVYEHVIKDCLQTGLRRRKAFIENAYYFTPDPHVKQLSAEFVPRRVMTIPIIAYNQIVALVVIVNKETNYTINDLRQLSLLLDTIWLLIEKQQASVAVRVAEEQVRQSERLKTIFLANISHEIRTPMNAILGFSQLLTMSSVNPDRREHFVEQINIGCSQLLNVINDLIEIAKIETGQMHLNETTISINSVIEELCDSYKKQLLDKNIELRIDTPLPASRSNIKVDVVKLVQILSNLLSNAIKFTNKGYVRIGYEIEDCEIQFFVEDSGIGIASENHTLIFERFWQVDMGSNRRFGGIGLGLAIAKAYILLLGGRLWMSSELGIGSIFQFSIPYIPTAMQRRVALQSADQNLPDLDQQRILIIEDDTSNFEFLSALLKSCNALVIGIRNGLEAVEYVKSDHKVDLILLDVKLPGIDGLEVARQLRVLGCKVPIIAQTANALVVSHDDAIAAGCNDYLAKPLVIPQLLELIVLHLSKS